jgi:hypothetical protein
MRHFVAYHKTEKMGGSLRDSNPFEVLSNNPTERMEGHMLWFVVGEGERPVRFFLGSVFHVAKAGPRTEGDYDYFARGEVKALCFLFDPHIPLKDVSWFPEIRRATANFRAPQEITDPAAIAGLKALADQAGHHVD